MIGRIEIPKRAASCAVCSASFSSGMTLHSSLSYGDKGAILRVDACLSCPHPTEIISSWKTVMPGEKKALGTKQKTTQAIELFEQLFKENAASLKLYLLALYLERRRILVRRDVLKGEDVILFESQKTGDIYPIPNMPLDDAVLQQLGEDLSTLL